MKTDQIPPRSGPGRLGFGVEEKERGRNQRRLTHPIDGLEVIFSNWWPKRVDDQTKLTIRECYSVIRLSPLTEYTGTLSRERMREKQATLACSTLLVPVSPRRRILPSEAVAS